MTFTCMQMYCACVCAKGLRMCACPSVCVCLLHCFSPDGYSKGIHAKRIILIIRPVFVINIVELWQQNKSIIRIQQ